ncbi:sugar ABC transporter substrate-binding protein [Clostridia bacterium]|nr:sugar ABC transporter substrate-binding protein [Clostridia bacterium]
MKKLVLILLVLMCSLNFVGCQSEELPEASNAEDGSNAISGEITFSTWGSLEEKKVNEDIIKLFEEKNPGVKVNLEYIPEEYTQRIDTMFLGKSAPDVIYGHPKYFAKWASQGLLMDLTEKFNENPELLDDSKYRTNLYDAFTFNGQKIATINGADTILLFYNKSMFDDAGIAYPNDDWTWDDFVAAATALTKQDENGKTIQYGVSIDDGYSLEEVFTFSYGASWYDDMNLPTEVTFDSPETIEGLQLMQDLIHKYKVAPSNSDKDILGGSFDSGKIAMDFSGVWAVVFRKDIEDFDWGLANIPVPEGQDRKNPALYAGYAISKTTENYDLSWEFAKFMQSDEAQKMLAASGLITVINKDIASSDEVIDIPGAPDNHMLRVTSLDYAVHNDAMVTNWEETITKVVTPNMQLLLDNKQDAATTSKAIHDGLVRMLEEAETTK